MLYEAVQLSNLLNALYQMCNSFILSNFKSSLSAKEFLPMDLFLIISSNNLSIFSGLPPALFIFGLTISSINLSA